MARKIADSISSSIKLNDGVMMPLYGLGVYLSASDGEAERATSTAIKHGYRLIDTAQIYKNEADVGKAVNRSTVSRQDLFVVTKLWRNSVGSQLTRKAFNNSLKLLDMSYVDLFLIHTPEGGKNVETYKTMLELKQEGLIRSVGVSNFGVVHLKGLKAAGLPAPSVNQIELHPWMRRHELVQYCLKEGIAVMGYSPLAKATKLDDPQINEIAKRCKKTAGQLLIRWSVQKGFITIPKSANEQRIIENAQVFDWNISEEDLKTMDSFAEESCCHSTWQPCDSKWKG